MAGKRISETDMALRVEAVRRLITQGSSHYEICQFVAKNWRASNRQSDRYIAEARTAMLEAVNVDRAQNIAEHLDIRRDLRRKMNEAKRYRDALAAAQDEAKLLGLYPAERLDINILRSKAREIADRLGVPIGDVLAQAVAIAQDAIAVGGDL